MIEEEPTRKTIEKNEAKLKAEYELKLKAAKEKKIDDFLNELNAYDLELRDAYGGHPPESGKTVNGIRDHKPGANPNCPHCIKIRKTAQKIHEFENLHLESGRMAQPTIQNTIKLIRNIIRMMKNSGEL